MKRADKLAWDKWASEHKLDTITFYWKEKNGYGECRLHDRTYNEAIEVAKKMGYREPVWYNPWTWANMLVTVG